MRVVRKYLVQWRDFRGDIVLSFFPASQSHCLYWTVREELATNVSVPSILLTTPLRACVFHHRIATGYTNSLRLHSSPLPLHNSILSAFPPKVKGRRQGFTHLKLLFAIPTRPLSVSTGASCQLHAASSAAAVAAWQTQAVV